MAREGGTTAAAISAAILSSAEQRYTAPEPRRWKGYWTRYWCFKSQKREKQIVPAGRSHGASESSQGWLPAQAVLALVPPSSPVSFVNSSVHSPVAASASICSPGPPNTMFTIGPYAHETQLVSPPVFSAFTTEPSTAAVTPPPEPHLTTPSSPDVPFAQYIASSLEAKAAARETISPLSTTTLPSPCDTPASHTPTLGHLSLRRGVRDFASPRSASTVASPCDTPASYTPISGPLYLGAAARETLSPRCSSTFASPCDTPGSYAPKLSHHYLGSPINCFVSPSVEYSGKEDVFPAESFTTVKPISPLFRQFNPFPLPDFSHTPFATLIVPCDSALNAEDSSPLGISEVLNGDDDDLSRMSKPKDSVVPILSEAHSWENLLHCNEAGGLCVGTGKEVHKGFLQAAGTGSMPSDGCNRVPTGVSCQRDSDLSTFKMKENDICRDGGAGLQKSLFYKFDVPCEWE
ncbi:hypothetical protein L7F22_008163 [Adiantum nelumboides]|nr:hypothetical protein [Adiantum nelumboides]